MTHTLLTAIRLTRAWTRLYTSALDSALRDERRAEIESDLWESHEDARRSGRSADSVALHIVGRVVRGVPQDVLWCIEHRRPVAKPVLQVAVVTGAALVLMMFWVMSAFDSSPLPPPSPSMVFIAAPPPPPPPPPPPLPESVMGKDGRVPGPAAALR
jgi:hypothetical protein